MIIDYWRIFERDFRELPDSDMRADYQLNTPDPDGMTRWRVAGSGDRARFEAIAVLAGQALWKDKWLRRVLPDEVLTAPDPLSRWLHAIRLMTGGFEWGRSNYEINDDGTRGSRTQTGCILRVIEMSALLCLKLAAVDHPAVEERAAAVPKPESEHAKPIRGRLELHEGRQQLRIDDDWHDYVGDKGTYLLSMLLAARGDWQSATKLEDPEIVIPRPDRIINRFPKEIKDLIETRKGGSGAYRIKPEYFG